MQRRGLSRTPLELNLADMKAKHIDAYTTIARKTISPACDYPGSHPLLLSSAARVSLCLPQGGRELATRTSEAYVKLCVARNMLVESAVYCGKLRTSARMLGCIVGLPTTYLNGLVEKCENGVISDIMTFLHEDWAKILYHDRFPSLRRELQRRFCEQIKEKGFVDEAATETTARDIVIKFLKLHATDLPAYTVFC